MSVESFLFYFFAAVALLSALAMVLNVRNTVAAAMSLVITMVALAGIFVLLEAHLMAAIQILVYAGAIVVLFVFVVMLLNLRDDEFAPRRQKLTKFVGTLVGLGVLVPWLGALQGALPARMTLPEGFGGYRQLGLTLFTDYVLPFEMTSLLLLAAIVGAVVLAKRRIA